MKSQLLPRLQALFLYNLSDVMADLNCYCSAPFIGTGRPRPSAMRATRPSPCFRHLLLLVSSHSSFKSQPVVAIWSGMCVSVGVGWGGTTGWKPFRREPLGGNGSVLYLDGGDDQLPGKDR